MKKNNISIKNKDTMEEKVINLLKNKGKCLYGDIIKELNLSYTKGQKIIFSLIHQGRIEHCDKSSELQINAKQE